MPKRKPPSERSWIASLFLYKYVSLFQLIRFTAFGTFYILFAIGIGAAAINTGNNLLYLVLGIQLSFIIISGFLSDSALWGLKVQWHPPAALFVGQRAQVRLEATKGWFPSVLVWVETQWNAAEGERVWLPWVRQSTLLVSSTLMPRQRGWLRVNQIRIGTPFPFGLFEKTHTHTHKNRWLVYPRILPMHSLAPQSPQEVGYESARDIRAGEGSIPYFLRDYQTGDPIRKIHWKASARRQRFMVKEMEEEQQPSSQLVIRAWPEGISETQMNDFISYVASLLWHSTRDGVALGLRTPDRTFAAASSLTGLLPTLRYLALVNPQLGPSVQAVGLDAVALWKQYAAR